MFRVFKKVGLGPGDELMWHADLRLFGLIGNNGRDLVSVIREIVGELGLVVTPSFTFSFPGIFDLKDSSPKTGAFPRLMSMSSDVVRVPDGMTSYYMLGAASQSVIDQWQHTSYGEGSIHDILIENYDLKILQIGTDVMSLVHHLEAQVGVPYRKVLRFEGQIKDGETMTSSYTDFYARIKDVKKLIPDPIRKSFFQSNCGSVVDINGKFLRLFKATDFLDFGAPMLRLNPYLLVKEE